MKNYILLFVSVLTLSFNSCTTMKDTAKTDDLYNTTWELEYISGPRIAFEGLYPDKKPYIKFDKEKSEVYGNAGCNGYSAPFTLKGNSLTFGEQGPATLMFCEGGGEQTFLQIIKKIDSYSINKDGKLNLNMKDIPMMRFKKVTK
ncbi:META domain-containing protein [[Flexibacter] sp. ATCC 35103]|uniref:META domain-containing protein n=1 Tax=[Flexibacter] sp. ATCC 35103 TaxID=1937528 RepID=UPI0009C92B72|nr:META domain-containing protein [[Flexibacter] sp. ATCC 35103]OMQ13058.1 META domain-containing protein [[Flexibacter] sp. ATCC 35103]